MKTLNTAHQLWMCLDNTQLISIIHDLREVRPSRYQRLLHTLTVNAQHGLHTEYAACPQPTHTHKNTNRQVIVSGSCVQRNMQSYQLDE